MQNKVGVPLAAMVLLAMVGACGSDSKGASAGVLQGNWKITTTRGTTTCSVAPGTLRYGLAVITQAAGSSDFTVTTITQVGGTVTGAGTISGNAVSLSVPTLDTSFSAKCTNGLSTNVTLTLDASNNAASGTSTWSCTYGWGSCTGSDAVTADRI